MTSTAHSESWDRMVRARATAAAMSWAYHGALAAGGGRVFGPDERPAVAAFVANRWLPRVLEMGPAERRALIDALPAPLAQPMADRVYSEPGPDRGPRVFRLLGFWCAGGGSSAAVRFADRDGRR